LILKKGGFRSR